jgi:hypothetical protein
MSGIYAFSCYAARLIYAVRLGPEMITAGLKGARPAAAADQLVFTGAAFSLDGPEVAQL